jgi:hypothetical protein
MPLFKNQTDEDCPGKAFDSLDHGVLVGRVAGQLRKHLANVSISSRMAAYTYSWVFDGFFTGFFHRETGRPPLAIRANAVSEIAGVSLWLSAHLCRAAPGLERRDHEGGPQQDADLAT